MIESGEPENFVGWWGGEWCTGPWCKWGRVGDRRSRVRGTHTEVYATRRWPIDVPSSTGLKAP